MQYVLIGSQGYEVHAVDITVGEQMQKLGCKTHQCDLRSESSIASFAEHFKNKRLDLLLNIAGVSPSITLLCYWFSGTRLLMNILRRDGTSRRGFTRNHYLLHPFEDLLNQYFRAPAPDPSTPTLSA